MPHRPSSYIDLFSAAIRLLLGAHPINTRNSSVRVTACRRLGLRGASKSYMCNLHVIFNGATINAGLLPCLLSESWGTCACTSGPHAMHHLQALACSLSNALVHPIVCGVSSGSYHAYLESQRQPTVWSVASLLTQTRYV